MTAASANFHDVNDTDSQADTKASKKKGFFSFGGERKERTLGWWGAAWRFTLTLAVFVAATIAIIFGMQYAVAYIAGLGLATLWTGIWTAVVTAIGYIITIGASWITGTVLVNILGDLHATKAAYAAAE